MPLALVTGATHGIGAGITRQLRSEGWVVATLDIEAPTDGADFHFDVDLADATAVDSVVSALIRKFGVPDALVNNAGIVSRTTILETPVDLFSKVVHVNLTSAYQLIQLLSQEWIKAPKSQRVVNITSAHAVLAQANRVPYAITKAGLEALTRGAATELGEYGIRVFAVAPGYTLTEPGRTKLEGERAALASKRVASKRLVQSEEVATAVGLLLSGKLDSMHGQVLRLDGGWSCTDIQLEDLRP